MYLIRGTRVIGLILRRIASVDSAMIVDHASLRIRNLNRRLWHCPCQSLVSVDILRVAFACGEQPAGLTLPSVVRNLNRRLWHCPCQSLVSVDILRDAFACGEQPAGLTLPSVIL